MDACACGGERLSFPLPDDCRGYFPGSPAGATLCTRCLRVEPTEDSPADYPDFQSVSDAFPRGGSDGARLAVLLWALDSLAHYRAELSELAERLERSGTDPLLFLDMLTREDGLEPHFELPRRSTQLEQLLYDV
jgi:hypothetical protein